MTTRILLDISCLILNAGTPTPEGIQRVELAYAEHWLATKPDHVSFVAKNILRNRLGLINARQAKKLIAGISRLWQGERASKLNCWQLKLYSRWIYLPLLLWRTEASMYRKLARLGDPLVYIIVSHLHLELSDMIRRLKKQMGAKLLYFVHDVIPLQFPEYFEPKEENIFRRRIEGAAQLADAIIVNSEATRAAFLKTISPTNHFPYVLVAPLGVKLPTKIAHSTLHKDAPYFVILGTIEPRKNHLLLFNLWRQLCNQLGGEAPRLIVIGSRGWENENVIDMIERSRLLAGYVIECGQLSDATTMEILADARALLQPSFAEGYGLPLAEALTLGVPAICSDIPAFHEVGGEVPEFIDPLDGPSWRQAILDYMAEDSPRRHAQLERLKRWGPRRWDEHFRRIDALIAEITSAQTAPAVGVAG